jgi:hypothetical protein
MKRASICGVTSQARRQSAGLLQADLDVARVDRDNLVTPSSPIAG